MIITHELTKKYNNGFVAVDRLSLNVRKGDIYGYLGPNGAGKTTTIRMLTGLIPPSSGQALVNGLDAHKESTQIKRIVGVLPESHGYYATMTGREYLTFFAELYDLPKSTVSTRVSEVLELVKLTPKADLTIRKYSRGMKQRLGLAKTMIHNPELIILDEPTLGLDPQGQRDINQIILDLNRTQGVTFFITSHLLKEVAEVCNRVAIVKQGHLMAEGSLDELLTIYGPQLPNAQGSLEDIFFHLTEGQAEQGGHQA